MFLSKDQLTVWMCAGHLHLSKKDYGFFSNINFQITKQKFITSNQDKLFSKLLLKYKKQIVKCGYEVEQLDSLIWVAPVTPSKDEYLCARIDLEDDHLIIRCPFNTKFIQNFKNIPDNYFVWDKVNKYYRGNASTTNLKVAYTQLNKYFQDVKVCPEIQTLLVQLEEYNNFKFWQPTLVKLGSNFYIYGISESLYDAIKNLEWSDDPKSILKLSQYGVLIDDSVSQNDELLNFAGNFYAKIDIDKIKDLHQWLKVLDYDLIFLGSNIIFNKLITDDIKEILGDIPISRNPSDLELYSNILYLNYNSYKRHSPSFLSLSQENLHKNISKVLTVTNSRPVYVK